MWREYVRCGDRTALERHGQCLGVDTIRFSTVLTDAKLLAPCRIDQNDLVIPAREQIVYVPGFPARFDRNRCSRLLRSKQGLQCLNRHDGRSMDNLAVGHFAVRRFSRSQIECYIAHG